MARPIVTVAVGTSCSEMLTAIRYGPSLVIPPSVGRGHFPRAVHVVGCTGLSIERKNGRIDASGAFE